MATSAHPADAIDLDAAVETMAASYASGGYWDARAVRVRPELAEAGLDDRWRILEMLAEDDPSIQPFVDEHAQDGPLSEVLERAIRSWLPSRAAYALAQLRLCPIVGGHVHATRAVQCRPDKLRSALGVHWSWDPEHCEGARVHWPLDDDHPGHDPNAPEILLDAAIPIDSVDWPTTLLCAMDYLCGDDEREIRVRDGASLTLLSALADGVQMPISDLGSPHWTA